MDIGILYSTKSVLSEFHSISPNIQAPKGVRGTSKMSKNRNFCFFYKFLLFTVGGGVRENFFMAVCKKLPNTLKNTKNNFFHWGNALYGPPEVNSIMAD